MTSQARARAAGAFLLPLIIALLRALPATGGACWSKVNSLGRCKEILSQGVTREQCCSGAIGGPKSSPRGSGLWTSGPRTSSAMSPSSSSSSSALTSVSSSVRVEEVGLRSEAASEVILGGGVGPETTAYSEEDYDNGALFFWQVLGGGVKCDSCRASCEGVRCAEGRRCVLRRGMPRCVCKAECRPGRPPEPEGPVCGSDGRTYRSLCELKRRACRKQASANELGLAYAGQCRSSCAGVRCRHGRSCLLDQNLSAHCVKCSRRCSLKPSDEKQLLALKPVCGVDGNTYKSACHLRAAACRAGRAIAIAYRGPCNRKHKDCKSIECRPGQRCLAEPNSGRPRCVTCLYRCPRGKQLVRERGPGRQRAYQDGTPLALCASNNLTYPSWCHIMKDACLTGIVLETRHAGPCNARDPPAFHNDDEADSINGNDGGRSNSSGPRKKASAKNLQRAMKKAGPKSLKNSRAPFVL